MPAAALSEINRRRLGPETEALIAHRLKNWEVRQAARHRLQRGNRGEAPLSFAQQRLWFLEQLEPGQPVYHVHCALRFFGPLHQNHLQAALDEIVRRHESLRTVFTTRDGIPIQRIREPCVAPLKVIAVAEKDLHAQMEMEAERPFDLGRDLMLRAALFQIAPEEHVLQFTLHHIASDAWSLELLLDECLRFYR
jgi:hypothetical protein